MKCLYAICRTNGSSGESDYYVTHGSMGGEPDAIGYSSAADARKFLSGQEAQQYIDQQLPSWGRTCHHFVSIMPEQLLFTMPHLSRLLYDDQPISDELLKPNTDKLLIWRH